ncbi:MMPL family transporter [Microvirga puerhi]|uniref:MMPL family transporter n=1 Tax=Microvirga puerhi TaxID=2876078 RepID=A0ABS7VR40_9HYPH|nr:MMPL family transporter [Microvirga puerhi]MBZ6077990.1 MMPL family transporter [Microvirga puerhi]
MLESSIERLVSKCIRRLWLVITVAGTLTLLSLAVASTRFAINTDTAGLFSKDVLWRRNEIAMEAAFPQRVNLIVAVIDGEAPEFADEAAARLTDALTRHGSPVRNIWRPDSSPFLARNGLLLLSMDELTRTTEELISQQGLLGPLAADPSLRGVMQTLSLGLQGVRVGQTTMDELAGPMVALVGVIESILDGKEARLSWQTLLSGKKAAPPELRRFVLIYPELNYNALQPGAEATDLIRSTVTGLGLTPDHGIRVRLTGPVPIADEEFGTLAENVTLNTTLTLATIGLLLYFALRSGRTILAVLTTLFVGLVVTTAVGLLMVGELNLISIAFAVLFVGLGVDFGIQFAMRYRAERHVRDDLPRAVLAAARKVGGSLTLAAVSLLAGFVSFLPTAFRGASELGLIAGVGMIIAYTASLTLLPALLVALRPPGEAEAVETLSLSAVDHWILRHRRLVIAATILVVTAGLPFLISLRFDTNPMNLRSKHVESVATYLDLVRDPATSPNSIDVLAPSLEEARSLSAKMAALPEVSRTVTLASFIPDDQDEKLGIIRDAAFLLDPVLHPTQLAAPPTDTDNIAALTQTAAILLDAAGSRAGASEDTARRLGAALKRVAAASPRERAAAQTAMTTDLVRLFDRLPLLMSAELITQDKLPSDLVADWIAPNGHARIEIFPSSDTNDNTTLSRFANAVLAVAPMATGGPIAIVESGRTVVRAFIEAGLFALGAIFLILVVALRKPVDVALTLGPLVLATIITLETASLIGLSLNFANILALPLMLAVGVAFHIYYIISWRAGVTNMLASSLTRAIFFSALTTGAAFGSLCFSSHPGTASMGQLLALSLFFTLLAAFIVVPAFLGPPRNVELPM